MIELNPRFLEIKEILLLRAKDIIDEKNKSAETRLKIYKLVFNAILLFDDMDNELKAWEATISQTILLSPKLLNQIDALKDPLRKIALVEAKKKILEFYRTPNQAEELLKEFIEYLAKVGLIQVNNYYNSVIKKRTQEKISYKEGSALSQEDLNFIETTVIEQVRRIIEQKCSANNDATSYIDILTSINRSILEFEGSFSDIFVFGQGLLDKIEDEKREITSKAKKEIEEKVFDIATDYASVQTINSRIIRYLDELKEKGIYTNNATYMEICTGRQLKK